VSFHPAKCSAFLSELGSGLEKPTCGPAGNANFPTMDQTPFRRILVMGCSRSGTTLLQSLLANHSQVHTFPETGVFLKALGMRGRVLPWVHLGLTVGKERKALAKLLATQERGRGRLLPNPSRLPEVPPRTLSLARSMADSAAFLDHLALAHGKRVWVEKTPRHVFHARRIGRMVPGVVCIHVLRKGEDVVASIVDRARRYPDHFPHQADPSYGIRQWNQSVEATGLALEDPGHVVVFYDGLVFDVGGTLRSLCRIVGMEFEPGMMSPADRGAFTAPQEEWKAGVEKTVSAAGSKFEAMFDEATRARVRQRLKTKNFDALQALAGEHPGGVIDSRANRL